MRGNEHSATHADVSAGTDEAWVEVKVYLGAVGAAWQSHRLFWRQTHLKRSGSLGVASPPKKPFPKQA